MNKVTSIGTSSMWLIQYMVNSILALFKRQNQLKIK